MSRKKKEPEVKVNEFEKFDFSDLNENFYEFERERMLKYKPLNERLSSAFINYDSLKDEKDFLKVATKYLSHTAYSLFNYITKEKNPIIIFNFESCESFCSLIENKIQIGTKILLSNDIPRQLRVDSLTAIIYHEFYHKRFTINDILTKNYINKHNKEDYYTNKENRRVVGNFLNKTFENKLGSIIHNIFEDRRIERLGVKLFPGYGFFFNELRKYGYYINKSYKTIDNPRDWIVLFLMLKILFPEYSEFFLKNLKDLKEKSKIEPSNEILSLVFEVIEDLNEVIESRTLFPKPTYDYILSDKYDDILFITSQILNRIPNRLKDDIKKNLSSETSEYFDLTNQEVDSNKSSYSKIDSKTLKDLMEICEEEKKSFESSELENKKDDDSTTEKILNYDSKFPSFTSLRIVNAPIIKTDKVLFNKARKLSNNIFRNLGFLDSHYKQYSEIYELTEGEIDETELYSLNWNKGIFTAEEEINGYNLDIGLLLDESGSMRLIIDEAKVAFLALMMALKNNKHINLFAYGHSANIQEFEEPIILYKYYNSLDNFVNINTIYSSQSRFNNGDGFAIYKMGEIMMKSKNKNKILIVLSDGQPAAFGYNGNEAIEHTRKAVESLERKNITVIQLCMNYIENSSKMFKHYIEYREGKDFFNELKNILMKKVMQFFMNL